MTVITRFAPSPTGMLHIGGVRTAYYNWLHAHRHKGKMLLRIEDTDRARSTPQATQAILEGMTWLGLTWDDEVIYQSQREARHRTVALELLAQKKAYHCYATADELNAMRQKARKEGRSRLYDGTWRNKNPQDAPADIKPTLRLKVRERGETHIQDIIQGTVTVRNDHLDDMILLRSDGSPTYMLAVVVDDHDMGITDIIRGDDHLTNSFRQLQIYEALGWQSPRMAHMPLLHGHDGAKLSKRHGAMALSEWQKMGYDQEALLNYLLRLGWSHGDDEIITRAQALKWFDIGKVGRAPSRFDEKKLAHINAHYLKNMPDDSLAARALTFEPLASLSQNPDGDLALLTRAMPDLKPRAHTLKDLSLMAQFYLTMPAPNEDARQLLKSVPPKEWDDLYALLAGTKKWTADEIEVRLRHHADTQGKKLKDYAQWLRARLTGSRIAPPLFRAMEILGQEEVLNRLAQKHMLTLK